MTAKKIADIRLFEQEGAWRVLPHYVGTIYQADKSAHDLAARMARILRNNGFITGDFDHLYIVLAPELKPGDVYGPRPAAMKRMTFYEVGVSIEAFNEQTNEEQNQTLLDAMVTVLKTIATNDEQLQRIEEAYQLLMSYGSEVEIPHLSKTTKSYTINVLYQIRPLNQKSTAIIEYIDLKNSITRRRTFLELNSYEDVYVVASSLTVKDGTITIKPRTSQTATLRTRSYVTPIKIVIDELTIQEKNP